MSSAPGRSRALLIAAVVVAIGSVVALVWAVATDAAWAGRLSLTPDRSGRRTASGPYGLGTYAASTF